VILVLVLWACDGSPDDSGCARTWYVDSDGDGFHAGSLAVDACTQPEDGYVLTGGDCDDGDISAAPDRDETCDGVDNDCDGEIDEDPIDAPVWYLDADEDTHGGTSSTTACTAPDGYVDSSDDCDDSNSATYPGAPEVCDAAANDCGAWDPSLEAGAASFLSADGSWSDVSADLSAAYPISSPGTLWLCEGHFTSTVEIRADADIRGRGAVILDASGAGPVVSVSAGATVQLENLILQGGSTDRGGGLQIAAGADVVVRDSVISGNVASASGGGIHTDGGAVALYNVEVSDNSAPSGGGIALETGSTLTTDGCSIHSNVATADGGGVYASSTSEAAAVSIEMIDTQLLENTASGYGGAMSLDTATAILETVVVRENTASLGGGGVVVTYATLKLTDTVLSVNTSTGRGAALYLDDHATVTCTSSAASTSSSTYGVHSSKGTYAVYINDVIDLEEANSLLSVGCDWGLDADDNERGDIFMGKVFDYTLDESFTCVSDSSCR
jgi:hypothetical protein